MATAPAQRYVVRVPRIDCAQLLRGQMRLPEVLRRMGYAALRPGQDRCVEAFMAGRDHVGILPTSTGKSACFAVPTLALGWRTLVFSPLISLMRDQEQSMNLKGVRAGCINSQNPSIGMEYLRQWMRGDLDILYVAPERLRRPDFMEAMRAMPPDAVVTDECHALSQWSVTFRSAYCVIGDFITEFQPKVVAAYSATLPPSAEEDVRRVMCIENAMQIKHCPRRTNLDVRSSLWEGDVEMVTLMERVNAPTIVYCASTKKVAATADLLQRMTGREIGIYHGKLSKAVKNHTQDLFQRGDLQWIVATNAFGMGVDKPDVRLVVHRDITGSIEATAQEIGRGGRDGKYTLCHTYFDKESVRTQRFLIDKSCPSFADVKRVYDTMLKAVGRDGVVSTSLHDICKTAGFEDHRIDAIANVLAGAQVIDRQKRTEKLCSLRLRNRISDPKLDDILDVMSARGEERSDGYVEVDLNTMVEELGVSEQTIKGRLKGFASSGVLDFMPPERAKPVRLTGDIRNVDADKIDGLRQQSLTRLDQTVQFARDVPDKDKHAFLEFHLGVENPA